MWGFRWCGGPFQHFLFRCRIFGFGSRFFRPQEPVLDKKQIALRSPKEPTSTQRVRLEQIEFSIILGFIARIGIASNRTSYFVLRVGHEFFWYLGVFQPVGIRQKQKVVSQSEAHLKQLSWVISKRVQMPRVCSSTQFWCGLERFAHQDPYRLG